MEDGKMTNLHLTATQSIKTKSTKSLRKAAFFAFVFGAMALPSLSLATESAQAPTMETGTVVVTATRTEQLLEDVSASMQVFDEEDIKKLGASNVEDVMRTVQGVQLGKKIGLRGMPSEGTTVLINGRRPAGELKYGTGANRTLSKIDVSRIERIEVLSGPSSALYGSTTGGVINIITKKSQEASGTVGIVGGNKQIRNYYTVDTGPLGKFDMLANFSWASNIPLKDKRVDDPATSYDDWTASADGAEFDGSIELGYNFNDDHRLTFTGNYFHENYFTESRSTSKTGRAEISKSYEEAHRYEASLVYDGTVGDHMYSLGFNYGALEEVLNKSDDTNRYQTYTIDFQDNWQINDQHLLTFGAEFKHEMANAKAIGVDSADSSLGLYVQDEMRFLDETLILTPALRFDYFEAWGTNWSPKFGAVWKFLEDHRLKANFGLGFRAPQVDELYRFDLHDGKSPKSSISGKNPITGNDNTSYGYIGNEDLKPEESVSWDVGYEGGYKNATWGVTYFWNDIRNNIGGWDWVQEPKGGYDGYFTFEQTDRVRSQGIEAKFGIEFLDYFAFRANYTWLDSRDMATNLFLDNAAIHTLRLALDFTQPDWGTTVSVWTETADHFYTNSEINEYTAFTTINASVSQEIDENFRVFASATNIGNVLGNDASYLDVDPMEWKLGLEITF